MVGQVGAGAVKVEVENLKTFKSRVDAILKDLDGSPASHGEVSQQQLQSWQLGQNFGQAGDYYRALSATGKTNLIGNLAADLGMVKHTEVRQVMLSHFYKADTDYGKRLTAAVQGDLADVVRRAALLQD